MANPKTTTTTPGVDTSTWKAAGRNVRYTTQDGMLFVAVDIRDTTIAAAPVSGSGKSKSIGTTLGNIAVAGSVKMGLNVYAPNG
jgi:hypothetical protein